MCTYFRDFSLRDHILNIINRQINRFRRSSFTFAIFIRMLTKA